MPLLLLHQLTNMSTVLILHLDVLLAGGRTKFHN